jgi:DNA-binding GntR family transcriptional regulator
VTTEPGESFVDELRHDIIAGLYHPRERLVEADLAAHYGVTRSSVRGALQQLATESLVDKEANRGARVRAMSLDEAIEIVEARSALEGLCAAAAAAGGSDDERAQLVRLLSDIRATPDDVVAYQVHSAAFHRLVRAMSRQGTAARLLIQLGNQSVERQFPIAFVPRAAAEGIAEHEAIADAVVAGDPVRAEALMRAHLVRPAAILRRLRTPETPAGGGPASRRP